VNFSRPVLRKDTRRPLLASAAAVAFNSGSVRKPYSLRAPGTERSSTHRRPYCLAKAMASSGVLPISSVMALTRDRSMRFLPHSRAAGRAPAAKRSRLVISKMIARPSHAGAEVSYS
jgi:hypothetical protein